MKLSDRLTLGSAQFGLPYGIANVMGQISIDEIAAILKHASAAGLNTLDTAITYGKCEQRLGDIGVNQWKIISKLPALPEDCIDVSGWVYESVKGALERLKINQLHGLLLHHPQQLLSSLGDELYAALILLKKQELVEKIGISIYSPCELDSILPHFHFDIVQTPFNVIDRRLVTSGWLHRLNNSNIEVHARSIFLQGLLLMDAKSRPIIFNRWDTLWKQWDNWLNDESLTPLHACLAFVLAQNEISRVVIGIDSLKQLEEILTSTKEQTVLAPESLMRDDVDLVDPSKWDIH